MAVRLADASDAAVIGQLLHDFNVEYDDVTPGPVDLAARVRELLAGGETRILVTGDPIVGLALLRFRVSLWTPGLECYLAELYVVPAERGHGHGRSLMNAAIELARREGADGIDLGTGENDTVARALYESLGFTNRGNADGSVNYFYELEL